MKKINLVILIGLLFFLPTISFAQQNFDFPVPELDSCSSHEECRDYCDNPSHIEECLDFAVRIGKINQEKANRIKEMNKEGFVGPGGCTNQEECKDFCDQEENMETCLQYDVDNGFMTQEKANQIMEGLGGRKDIVGPGGCTSPEECKNYCNNQENLQECLDFSVAEGRMDQDQADEILQKIEEREILREERGDKEVDQEFSFEEGPGGCSSEEECNEYCNKFENLEECLDFEVEIGGLTREEADDILRKERAIQKEAGNITPDQINSILQKVGGGPGGCMSQDECDSYCGNEENGEECINFAKEHGLMNPEKAEKIKNNLAVGKTLKDQGGPGGCTSPEECKNYCDQEENGEECINFGRDHGLMTSEKAQQLKNQIEIRKELEIMGGPGGCSGLEECKNYCSQEENREECLNFGKEKGLISEVKAREVQKFQEIKKRKEEKMEKQGKAPDGTEIRTEKDMNMPKDMNELNEMSEDEMKNEEMMDYMPPEGEIIDETKDMMPQEEMKNEEPQGEMNYGPQSLLKGVRSFMANIGFLGFIQR